MNLNQWLGAALLLERNGVRMNASTRVVHVGLSEALTKGPPPSGNLAVPIFSHGTLVVEMYTPVGADPQKPHTRDEVYFVARGEGFIFDGQRRHKVEPGSFVFVPAGEVHRFEDFSSDFAVWVAFYGPEGGEADE
jgi:mannose-6-phosphate isomerase-like protein (cupin superfamily)